jgi:hypothetical protein
MILIKNITNAKVINSGTGLWSIELKKGGEVQIKVKYAYI